MISRLFFKILLITSIFILVGCRPAKLVDQKQVEPLSPTISPTMLPVPEITSSISSTPLAGTTVTPKPTNSFPNPTLIETGDVLRFTFPTLAQDPVSIWRPPLYPVPWGLNLYDHFLFIRPIAANAVNWALPNYRYGGIFTGTDIIHTGIDIDAPQGTPVSAAGPGIIRWAGFGLYMNDADKDDPYGLAVAIEHDFGYQGNKLFTIYAHMDRIDVIKGQHVNVGEQIGIVGNTGNTTGPHLHFEIRIGDNNYYTSRNPELWLSPPQGWGVLVGRIMWSGGSLLEKKPLKVESLATGQTWEVITYGPLAINQDDFYLENLALSDLPAGEYKISIIFYGQQYHQTISIQPGAVTYVIFQGVNGFSITIPPTPAPSEWFRTQVPTP